MRQRLALVVGINGYPEPYSVLCNAIEDASRVAGFLEHRLGFDVTFLSNKTASEVDRAFWALVDKLKGDKELTLDSQLFFYFSGHGLCVGSSPIQSLLCADASRQLLDGVYSASGALSPDALENLSRNVPCDMITVLDVCRTHTRRVHDGPEIQRGGEALRDAINRPRGERVLGCRATLHSCKDGQSANDDGVFAKALVEEMGRLLKDGCELNFGYDLAEAVARRLNAGQTPVLSLPVGERIVLVPGKRSQVKPPKEEERKETITPPPPATKTATQLTNEANAALQAGRYEEAERLAEAALELNPTYGRAIWVRNEARRRISEHDQIRNEGWFCLDRGEAATALRKADILLKEFPKDEDALALKALAEKALIKQRVDAWSESSTRAAGFRQELEINGVGYGFCWIPAGEFNMGSPTSEKGRNDNERLHHVKLTRGFWLLETPVIQELYESVMKTNPSRFKGADHPVENVSWHDAVEFCQELTKSLPEGMNAKLPTEAQWEYACRAGTSTAYWYGNTADWSKMGAHDDGEKPVKRYVPNPWGLYDMHGSIYEWCLDLYGNYPTGTVVDPKEGTDCFDSWHVIRSGCWHLSSSDAKERCRSAWRDRFPVVCRSFEDHGFRFLLSCD